MSKFIIVNCPNCQTKLRLKQQPAGTARRCPKCGTAFAPKPPADGTGGSRNTPATGDTPPKPTASEASSRSPLWIVLACCALIGAGLGIGFMLFGGGDDAGIANNGDSKKSLVGAGQQPQQKTASGDGKTVSVAANDQPNGTRVSPTNAPPSELVVPLPANASADNPASPATSKNTQPTTPAQREPDNETPAVPSQPNPPTTVANAPSQPGTSNSIGMTMQLVKRGFYVRGRDVDRDGFWETFNKDHASYGGFSDERPYHDVLITKPFLIGKHEVTVAQFRQFVSDSGYQTTAEKNGQGIVGLHGEPEGNSSNPMGQRPEFTWKAPGFEQSDNHPVVGVSWDDAQAFCKWLSNKEGVTYRLPTEAEWEWACRAGTNAWFSFGDVYLGQFHRYANLADQTLEDVHEKTASWQWIVSPDRDGAAYTRAVGSYQPNAWGLHDMHGNVWEWCQDVYSDVYYTKFRVKQETANQAVVDVINRDEPVWEDGDFRVIRGGAWTVAPIQARSATRGHFDRTDAACYVGFRVVREAPAQMVDEAVAYRQRQAQAENAVKAFERASFTHEHGLEGDPSLVKLNLNRPTAEIAEHLGYLTRVRFLQINFANESVPEIFPAIAKMKSLRRLVLSFPGMECPAEAFDALADLEQLGDLRFAGECRMTVPRLAEFKSLPNLEILEISNSTVTDEQLLALRHIQFPKLKSLNIQRSQSDGSGLAGFTSAPLETVHLSKLTDAGAAVVARFPKLKSLQIQQPMIGREGLAQLTALTNLERLDLTGLKQLNDADFGGLSNMTGLVELELAGSGAGDQTAAAIKNLLLVSLKVNSPNFTDAGLKHIGNITTLNNVLEIGGQCQVTDAGLAQLWGPRKLRNLWVYAPSGITGTGFETISDMARLMNVQIYSEDFTDTGMRYLGYLPVVQRVTLGHNGHGPKGVTDDGLLMLAEAPNLKHLTLHRTNCPVTDAGIERLKQARPDIELNLGR